MSESSLGLNLADSFDLRRSDSSSCPIIHSFHHSTMTMRLLGLYPRILSPFGSLLATTRLPFATCVPFSTTADKNGVEVTKTATSEPGPAEAKPPKRRRRRTAFGADGVAAIPSFEEFQQQVAIRTLYRQFLRLVKPLKDSSPEIGPQIRREFRVSAVDSWQAKRALSEGGRRYKELAAMLGTPSDSNGTQKDTDAEDVTQTPEQQRAMSKSAYPWQQSEGTAQPQPSRFPKKTPGSI
jgi:hypothetical protein